jgi:hypothetical protein
MSWDSQVALIVTAALLPLSTLLHNWLVQVQELLEAMSNVTGCAAYR